MTWVQSKREKKRTDSNKGNCRGMESIIQRTRNINKQTTFMDDLKKRKIVVNSSELWENQTILIRFTHKTILQVTFLPLDWGTSSEHSRINIQFSVLQG